MRLLILCITFIAAVVSIENVFANTVLVPDSSVSFEQYTQKCKMDGYTCTQKYFYDEQVLKPTPQFDALIDSIDLTNKDFVGGLPKAVQGILQKEMLSVDQLEMLMRLLEQSQDQQGKESKALKQLADELRYVQSSLPNEKNLNLYQEKFIVFFKKAYTVEQFKQVKKSYLNLPYTEIYFNRVPLTNSVKTKSYVTNESLVTGVCEKASINDDVNISQWKVMSEKNCSWGESFDKSTSAVTSTIKENKGWILTGALLVGAAILASQYEVKFQF